MRSEILQANDRLLQGLTLCEQVVGSSSAEAAVAVRSLGEKGFSETPLASISALPSDGTNSLPLIDFSELDPASQIPMVPASLGNPDSFRDWVPSSPSARSLDEELMSVDLPNSPVARRASEAPPPRPPCSSSLAALFVPLDSVTLSAIPPITVFEWGGLKAMLHFSRDPVPGHPFVRVLVISLLSTSPHPIQGIVFQAAVPKSMAIKLQPATGSELPAFNPLLPPAVISQVLLLNNPQRVYKATDPSSPEENWQCIQRFCDQVNNAEADGPSTALRLLEHKIQSPQEAEALRALTVLEMCVNNCGENFHHEMGKFRFLNGLIKVLSPKYLGEWSTERVKSRIIEILFSWTVWFPQEVKIRDAYQMLKKQARLLKSKNPEDLQAANRLIKGLIKEEQEKSAKVSRRVRAIKEAHSSAKALEEMLSSYKAKEGGTCPKLSVEALQVSLPAGLSFGIFWEHL
ncbi:hypothetical protein JD844_019467 [Phrynosoma platyrhinos]|uniref:ADP-ribosylation factor-binding protein GGA2 n=1 Tax=Phrynosoma platyrhinos TaxID=52577 RepID=A0ABQ7TQP4_PHRPL|nr:hypothetical protein JD844_019467 [Phrynosoma platyrhinos]